MIAQKRCVFKPESFRIRAAITDARVTIIRRTHGYNYSEMRKKYTARSRAV